jgi:hypothetical protein
MSLMRTAEVPTNQDLVHETYRFKSYKRDVTTHDLVTQLTKYVNDESL